MIKNLKPTIKLSFYTCLFLISFFSNAYAYLDPGTGGLIIQGLIASIIGVGVFFKSIKIKVMEFLFKKKIKKKHINNKK